MASLPTSGRINLRQAICPISWSSLYVGRTTNAIERLNEEFRRRIKTQTMLPCAETAPMLFWALLASGQIQMRKVDGLCCTNPVRDSCRESSVVAGMHEQTDTPNLQDEKLAGL